MSNFQSPFRDMASVPSQLSAAAFGSSSNVANPFSGSQSPFAFGGSSGSGGLGPSQSSSALGQSGHQRPTTLGGMGGLFGNIGGGSISFGAAGRSMTPNPSSGPPPAGLFQQSTPQQTLPPSILTPTGQQPPQQHSPGGGAVPPLLNGPPPSASRNLLPTLLNGVGGSNGPVSSSSGLLPLGAPSSSQGSLGGSNAMGNFFSHSGPGGGGGVAGNSTTSNFSFGGSPVRALSSLGALQSSVQQGQHKQAQTSGMSGLLSIASGKEALLSLRGSGGSSYENDFLHSSSPFSMSSTSAVGGPPPIGPGLLKGDSSSGGQQQQAAAAAALALINRYTGGMKGFNDFHPSQYQTAFGHHNSSTPLGFNENEFPSLSAPSAMINRGAAGFGSIPPPGPIGSAFGSRSSAASRSAYANLMKQTVDPQPEFQIHNEDFPALPGSQDTANNKVNSPSTTASGDAVKDARFASEGRTQQQTPKRGIQTHPDGTVTGIPAGMLNDQFGMVGLLTFLRAIETDPSIVSLALGHDLTQLGLNLNAPEKNLYQTFGGPWSDVPCRPQDIDCHVPSEYMTNAAIADKLAPIKLNRYGEDLLFYLFYNFGGEMFQLAAAAELYNRDWRYHKEERVWLSRAPGMVPLEKSSNYERGTYYVFDPSHWRKIAKEMHLEYDKLEERPMLPPQVQQPQHLTPSQSQPTPQQPSQSNIVVSGAAQTS